MRKILSPVSYWPIFSSLFALCGYAALHTHGIQVTPDGWAYWQGAVSLTEGRGYTYFYGHPIIYWPPLYSLYLAGWTSVIGPYGATLIIANGLLVTVQAFVWFNLCLSLVDDIEFHTISKFHLLLCAFYIGIFTALTQSNVLAHVQLYTLLPIFILLIWWSTQRVDGVWGFYIGAALLAAACLLTHNSSVVFVAAGVILIIVLGQNGRYTRIAGGTFVLIFSLLVWGIIRMSLTQSGSHYIGGPHYSIYHYALQVIEGIGELIVPKEFALACILLFAMVTIYIIWKGKCKLSGLIFSLLFFILSLIMLIVIFRLVDLPAGQGSQGLNGRFVLFVPLLVVPMLLLESARVRPGVFVLVVCMAIPVLAYRSFKWSFVIDQPVDNQGFVSSSAELSHIPAPGKSIILDGRTLVAPKLYPWEEQANR